LKENVFENLENLEELYLNLCKIENLPEKIFYHLKKLKLIDLAGNQLTHLYRNLFLNNIELEQISLTDNKIKQIDIDFTLLSNVKSIDLTKNICVSSLYPKVSSTQVFQDIVNNNCSEMLSEKKEEKFVALKFSCEIKSHQQL
jgi:Leucine-rich repeat (LRR) protein